MPSPIPRPVGSMRFRETRRRSLVARDFFQRPISVPGAALGKADLGGWRAGLAACYALAMSRIHRSLPPKGSRIGIAYSGGLDTRCAVAWFARSGLEVYAYTAN